MKERIISLNLRALQIPMYKKGDKVTKAMEKFLKNVVSRLHEEVLRQTTTASTSDNNTSSSTSTTTLEPVVQTSTQTPVQTTTSMDWMSEYGNTSLLSSQDDSLGELYNPITDVWNNPVLGLVSTNVASRYLRRSLQGLIDSYNTKIAEIVGQKRT